jgi:predicted Zn-dependent protease
MTGELKEQNSDTIFQDAIDALRRGDKPRAKELLTLLLKSNQNNPIYWIWLSAAVDSQKERIYCLQTALKLDPENGTAKRGLILLGALTPDDTIQPFPMNRPRTW